MSCNSTQSRIIKYYDHRRSTVYLKFFLKLLVFLYQKEYENKHYILTLKVPIHQVKYSSENAIAAYFKLAYIIIPRRSRRDIVSALSVHLSVRATDMDLGAFLVVWRKTRGHFLTRSHGSL